MKRLKIFSRKQYQGVASLFLVLLLLFLTACGSNGNTNSNASDSNNDKPIKIGALLTFSGPFASAGEGMKQGIETFLETNNYQIGNRKVEVVYEDDENNPQVSLRKLNKLIDSDKVDVILGGVTSTVVYAIADAVEQNKIPFIIINAGANDVSWSKKSDYIYRSSFSNYQLGSAPATLIAKYVGKKVFVVAQDYPAGHEQADAFEREFKAAGGTDVQIVYPKVGASDFATYISQIAEAKPDVVYTAFGGPDAVRFAVQYNSFGLKGKIPLVSQVADEEINSPDIMKALDGERYFTPYYYQVDNPANKKFVEAFKKKYNRDPSNYMELGYDAAQMLVKAIEKAGSSKSEDIIKVLKDISIESPRGNHVMDPKTHNPVVDFYLTKYVVKDGKMHYELLNKIEKVTMPENNPGK
jgi:branched-chain amino acid transport system substrate-binding protein